MGIYGRAAVHATTMCYNNKALPPYSAWMQAISKGTTSDDSRSKLCPRGTYLGLCEEGVLSAP